MLVRTWNLFHGNTVPPGRRAYLREMVELVCADRPDVVCLQEVPVWALPHVGPWAGMRALSVETMPPRIGPLAIPALLGRALTSIDHGLLRSAFSGQGNVILLPASSETSVVQWQRNVELNTIEFRRELGKRLDLSEREVRAWSAQRRWCQIVRAELDGAPLVVANVHLTSRPGDPRLAEAELRRVLEEVEGDTVDGELVVLAGDLNLKTADSEALQTLGGWQDFGPGIDHILVRAAGPVAGRVWPDEEREYGGLLLSDHAPVELTIEAR